MRTGLVIALALIFSQTLMSQEKFKFGKISDEEVKSTVDEKFPDASAIVLYEEMDTRFTFDRPTGTGIINRYVVRIKILTNDGVDNANQFISTRLGRSNLDNESISGFTGYTYNWVGDKVEKTKLSKENIFVEKVTEYLSRTKFAFPLVKAGSVIEYKYELSSPRFSYLEGFKFQRSIPVKYSRYFLQIPEYFTFDTDLKGYEKVKVTKSQESVSYLLTGGNTLSCSSNNLLFEVMDLPSLKDENYVWNLNDFMTRVTLELKSVMIPGTVFKNFSSSWAAVNEELLNSYEFGKQLNTKYFKDELSALITPQMDTLQKIRTIYNLVKSRVKWNDVNSLWIGNPREALKKGVGSSAEINALLICALKEAGLNSYPVVTSLRNRGRIPITHPTIDYLNYFIVGVVVNNKHVYLDASSKFGDLNVIPVDAMSDYARSVHPNIFSNWINLTNLIKSNKNVNMSIAYDSDGSISGDFSEYVTGQSRYIKRIEYSSAKSEQEYIEDLQSDLNLKIKNFSISGNDCNSESTTTSFKYTKGSNDLQSDKIFIQPLFASDFIENPFKAEFRKLPIEFSFPYTYSLNVFLTLPEGYEIDELPLQKNYSLPNRDATLNLIVGYNQATNAISMKLRFELNKILFSPLEYPQLREFFALFSNIANSQVVLKKSVK